ncbi:hypothetical protein KP509_22G009200 [Ceratopteris richardii]|nr:hypothetical protein KP509_22G009200 [Ceratopteris richardii]
MTARGGLEQVIKACQWRELSDALDIPKNICSASFVLRKLYSKLLFHYEQVYYFRMEGQLQSPPVSLPAPNPVGQRVDDASPYEIPVDLKASYKKRKRKLDPLQVFGVDPVASVGSVATGAINGKFEDGYFITVVVGTEKLSGVLYHLPASNNTQQYANIPSLIDTIGHEGNAPGMELQLYKFKKKRDYVRKFNPDAPKRTRSAYNIFFKEQCARLKQLLPGKKGLGKTVTEMWNKLSDKEKEPYIARGSQERERYLAEHREKLRLRREVGSEGVHNSIGHSAAVYDGSHDYHVSLDAVHDIHGRNPRISDVGQPYGVYNGSEHAYISESEITDIHLVSNQVHENHENEGNYLQGTLSEGDDDGDAHLEEQYEEEDMQDCPLSENGYEEENGTEYHVSDPAQEVSGYPTSERNPDVPEDVYRPQTDEISVQETEEHGCDTAPKAPFYTHDHGYNYGSSVSQEQMAETPRSNNAAHFEHMVYQMHNNGQVMYTPAQQGCPESSANSSLAMPQQHYFPHSRYAYRPGQGGEALGLPVPQDQGSFSRQDEGSPFLASYQQSQSLGTGSHAQQIPSEVAYRGRYTYPLAMPYSHVYTQPPHAYGQCFPRPPYPLQPNDAVTYQYQHGYVSQVHQPLACVPEGSGMQSSQMYQPHDGGRVLHFQDGNSRPVFKHGADK